MKKFDLPLDRVRRWRELQAELEEERLGVLFAESARIQASIEDVDSQRAAVSESLVSFERADSQQLAALDSWRGHLGHQRIRLEQSAAACADKIRKQQEVVVEARKRHRLLERLKDRALKTWQYEVDREQEQVAAEVHLAIHHVPRARLK